MYNTSEVALEDFPNNPFFEMEFEEFWVDQLNHALNMAGKFKIAAHLGCIGKNLSNTLYFKEFRLMVLSQFRWNLNPPTLYFGAYVSAVITRPPPSDVRTVS